MLKEAMEYFKEKCCGFQTISIGDRVYSDKELNRIPKESTCDPVYFSTLDGILDYIRTGMDRKPDKQYFLQVSSPHMVELCAELNTDRKRETLARGCAELPDEFVNHYYDTEEFIIGLRTRFERPAVYDPKDTDIDILIKIASNVSDDASVSYTDDGLSQRTQMNSGIGTVSDAIVPDVVQLKPFRTFREVGQPESSFIFRMKKGGNGILFALFEADGGAWKEDAARRIDEYCTEALKDCQNVHVLR